MTGVVERPLGRPRPRWHPGALPGLLSRRPWLLTAALCAVVLALPPVGPDTAAHEFRSWLFRTHGLLLWQNQWYAGHPLLGYSVLYPPLAALVGTRLLGALACVWAAAAGTALLRPVLGRGSTAAADTPGGASGEDSRGTRLAAGWFAVGCTGLLVQGQLPFALGLALGLTALLALRSRHPIGAGVAALAGSLASPLAGAFLLLAALAWVTEAGLRRVAPLAAAAVGVAIGVVFGGGGWFPFPLVSVLTVLGFCAGGLVLTRHGPVTLRSGLWFYGAAALVCAAVPNALGGNVARLGALAGGPLAALVLGRQRRRRTLAVVAVPLLLWQGWPVATAALHAAGDPSSRPGYYAGLRAFLQGRDPADGRLEIPTLRQHWEAAYVAPTFPLARGWERQVDLRDNAVLYDDDLTAAALHTWLLDTGVSLVALPDAPLDPWSVREGALLVAGQPWLVPVWHDAHWRVWQVADAQGLTSGPARVSRLGVDEVTLAVSGPGQVVVRLHWSRSWRVTTGRACLSPAPGGWLAVRTVERGSVTVATPWPWSPSGEKGAEC